MNTVDNTDQWKIELADAIIAEACFNGCPIKPCTAIEHQLGTVWVGSVAITPQASETDALDKACEKWDIPQ